MPLDGSLDVLLLASLLQRPRRVIQMGVCQGVTVVAGVLHSSLSLISTMFCSDLLFIVRKAEPWATLIFRESASGATKESCQPPA